MQLLGMLPFLAVVLLSWSCRLASAKVSAYNLTESVVLPFKAVNQHGGKCTEPGSCTYANVTVKANQIAYFCGYDATYKVKYHWKAAKNLQTFLARERHLTKCDIRNFDGCHIIKATKCSKVKECTKGRYGTVFGGSMCFAIVNNRDTSSWINFKVDSREDKSLPGGRAGCILLTIVMVAVVFEPLVRHFLPNLKAALGKR